MNEMTKEERDFQIERVHRFVSCTGAYEKEVPDKEFSAKFLVDKVKKFKKKSKEGYVQYVAISNKGYGKVAKDLIESGAMEKSSKEEYADGRRIVGKIAGITVVVSCPMSLGTVCFGFYFPEHRDYSGIMFAFKFKGDEG